MRGEYGKLICTWSPVQYGVGSSTLACSVGFGIHCGYGKKVLIVNKGRCNNHMEKYLEKDIAVRYSMDNLKIFNAGIKAEHIQTYATQVNTDLYMIAGSRLKKGIVRESYDFDRLFIERCLEVFDIVVADIDAGVRKENKYYLEKADRIISVFAPNEIIIDELYQSGEIQNVLAYFTDKKVVSIINKLHSGWESDAVIGRYKSKYLLSDVFGLEYDGDVLNACCTDRNFYSFFMKNINNEKNEYIRQMNEICNFLAHVLNIKADAAGGMRHEGILRRILKSNF